MVEADKKFQQFYFQEAYDDYIKAIDGYMEVIKETKDDKNLQSHLKQ